MPVPDTLDLEQLRGTGPAHGETLQPEEDKQQAPQQGGGAAASAAAPVPDDAIVASLVSMGFSENGSKRAGELLFHEGEDFWEEDDAVCTLSSDSICQTKIKQNRKRPVFRANPPKTTGHANSACDQQRRCRGGHRVGVCPHGGRRLQRPASGARPVQRSRPFVGGGRQQRGCVCLRRGF